MSDAPEALGRRLIASVRRERPSAALRERVLALGRAERVQLRSGLVQRAPFRQDHVGYWTAKRRAGWSLGLGAFALAAVVFAMTRAFDGAESIVMSREQSGPSAARGTLETSPPSPSVMSPPPVAPAQAPSSVAISGPKRPKETTRQLPLVKADAGASQGEPRSTLAEQLEQIKNARAALRAGDPARALALVDAYQARSRGGELSAEASLLQIEALAVSGGRSEAARLARKFAVDHPNSPLIDRALAFTNE